MNKKTLVTAALLVVIIGGAFGVSMLNRSATKDNQASSQPASQSDQSMSMKDTGSAPASDAPASTTNAVTIAGYAFSPKSTTVKVGTTVTWTNQDAVRHTVTADKPSDAAPMSQLFAKGETYSFTFKKAGTYSYFCQPHPYMKGTVVVTE